jgi:hypothetical protein
MAASLAKSIQCSFALQSGQLQLTSNSAVSQCAPSTPRETVLLHTGVARLAYHVLATFPGLVIAGATAREDNSAFCCLEMRTKMHADHRLSSPRRVRQSAISNIWLLLALGRETAKGLYDTFGFMIQG